MQSKKIGEYVCVTVGIRSGAHPYQMLEEARKKSYRLENCYSCERAKAVRSPRRAVSLENRVASEPFGRVYSVVVRPVIVNYSGKSKYFVTLLDGKVATNCCALWHWKER